MHCKRWRALRSVVRSQATLLLLRTMPGAALPAGGETLPLWSVSPPCIAYLPSLRPLLRHCVKCCMFGTGRMLAYLWCVILSHLLSILLNSNHELSFNIGRHVSEHYSMHTGLILSVVSAIHWGSWIGSSPYKGGLGEWRSHCNFCTNSHIMGKLAWESHTTSGG